MAQIILDWNPEILVRIPRRRKYIYRICTYFDFRILGTDKHIGLRFTYASHLAYASIWTDYSKSLFGLWLSKCQNSITCILYRRHQSVVACYFYPELSTTSKIGKRQHFFFQKGHVISNDPNNSQCLSLLWICWITANEVNGAILRPLIVYVPPIIEIEFVCV